MALMLSVGFLSVAFIAPTSAKVEAEAARCSPTVCTTTSGIGICCLVATDGMSCSPCGAFDPPTPPKTPELN
ncbi:hypothetical protein [Pedobacter metabolipauper]|nr:hypothetical protein [Pedobacter metabolipauper]